MHDIWLIMKFTMQEMLHRKSFIISTIIILLMIIIGANVPNIVKVFKGEDEGEKVIISDPNNIYENQLEAFANLYTDYKITITSDDIDTVKDKILNDDVSFAIVVNKSDYVITLDYVVENAYWNAPNSQFTESLINYYKSIQISKLGLSDEQLQSISPNYELNLLQAEEETNGNIMAMMMMAIVLFYAVYFCAFQVSSSITIEKTSKIIETLVTSTKPTSIVLGKTLGIGIVGLLQMVLILATAVLSAKFFMETEALEAIIDPSSITASLLIITLVYFILGYFTYALMYALTGSTVSKPEEIQSANTPVALITVIGFYLAYFTMMDPTSNLNVLASLLPISSPFCMPFRVMMGLASAKDVVLSIVILIITIIIVAKVAIRIYSNAILNYGTKMSFKDILKMYKQK